MHANAGAMLLVTRALCALVATLAFFGVSPAAAMTSNDPAAYARIMRAVNPHLALYQSRVYASTLLAVSKRAHVDPKLVMAVVTVESHWNYRARSIHGAIGLGQLKPETAHDLRVDPRSGVANLRGIATYLSRLLAFFRTTPEPLRAAVAGYNAGPYAIGKHGGVPQNGETPRYVVKVMHALAMVRGRLGSGPLEANAPTAAETVAALERANVTFWGVR